MMWRPLVEQQRHKDAIRIVVHAGDTETHRTACGQPAGWTWLWRPNDVFAPGPVQGAACCPLCAHLLDDPSRGSEIPAAR